MSFDISLRVEQLLDRILKQTGGAFFIPAAEAGRLIDGRHIQTTYRQIENGRFPLPTVHFRRNWVVRVHDLAEFLATGCSNQDNQPIVQKNKRGRPLKYKNTRLVSCGGDSA